MMTNKLDMEVAERVMTTRHSNFHNEILKIILADKGRFTGEVHRHILSPPPYSTNPIACAEVKKHLLATGIEFHIGFNKTGVHVGYDETHDEFYGDEFSGRAQTEEEAVCLFALECAERGLLRTI